MISNGVINLSPDEAAGVLGGGARSATRRPAGLADIVSEGRSERTRRNVDLWAACIAGAIPRTAYLGAIEAAGFTVGAVRVNDYRFVSERARRRGDRYGVTSVSVLATKPEDVQRS